MIRLDPSDATLAHADERLRTELIAWLTTVGADGTPKSTPVWFLWDGRDLLVYSRPGKPKLRNLASNPHVSVHLEGNGLGGDNVILEGVAHLDDGAPPADRVSEYLRKYRDRIAQGGWTPASFASDYTVPVRIDPTRIRVW
ncbi:MAG TPA: TIGR03667 family PPOX class F420-dependent oxidoreductase [Actinomycetota bacterium]|nr:TIGR03667 family PPOX class F420-dependent oxidoreductase [Actinomycetota bacterium]